MTNDATLYQLKGPYLQFYLHTLLHSREGGKRVEGKFLELVSFYQTLELPVSQLRGIDLRYQIYQKRS